MDATRQQPLIFSREEKLMLAAAAQFDTPSQTRKLRALVEQLELVGGSKGCFPSQRLLAGRLAVTDRTIRQWLAWAEERGIVARSARIVPGYGQIENLYQVDWQRVRSYVPPAELARIDHRLGRLPSRLADPLKSSGGGSNFPGGPGNYLPGPPGNKRSARRSEGNDFTPAAAAAEHEILAAEVRAAGVDRADEAVATALHRGATAELVRQVLDAYRRRQGPQCGPGCLYVALTRLRPDSDPERGWPKQSVGERRRDPEIARQRTKSALAIDIIKTGRRSGKSDDTITVELLASGLTWDDQDH